MVVGSVLDQPVDEEQRQLEALFNLRQVECSVCSVEQGTMTAAADQLLVSQSAVSLAIAGLENAIGTQLLVRRRSRGLAHGRRLRPRGCSRTPRTCSPTCNLRVAS
jgi:hypothetical protein